MLARTEGVQVQSGFCHTQTRSMCEYIICAGPKGSRRGGACTVKGCGCSMQAGGLPQRLLELLKQACAWYTKLQ